MATVESKPLTAAEFLMLPEPPDGSRQELVKGTIVAMPPPGFEHGEIQIAIASFLRAYAKAHQAGRVVAETGVVTEQDPDSVRGPDVAFWSAARLALDARIVGYPERPPDLCVEIRSPSQRAGRLHDKVKEYLACGVRQVWVVDPDERSVTVHRGADEGHVYFTGAELECGDVLPGFRCCVADLFG